MLNMLFRGMRQTLRGVRFNSRETPCRRACETCDEAMVCMSGRGYWRPIPWILWAGFAGFVSVPLYANTHPYQWCMWTEKGNIICEADQELKNRVRNIFRNVGVLYPENVEMLIVREGDLKVIGTNTHFGAVVLIPEDLASMADPKNPMHMTHHIPRVMPDGTEELVEETIYDGPISEMPSDVKELLLEEFAYLVPEQSEIDYLFGHEGSHLLFNHAFTSAVWATGFLVASHGLAKWTHRFWQPSQPRLRFPWHIFQTLVIAMGITGVITRKQERDADILSAKKLHLEHEAADLVRKKIQQNLSLRKHGDMGITQRGNDRFEWTHPSLTQQLDYLSRLE